MPLGVHAILATKKGIWWEEDRSCKNFEEKKHDYVQEELHKFDKHVKAIEERAKWGWSPLHHLLKQFPLQVGPQCP